MDAFTVICQALTLCHALFEALGIQRFKKKIIIILHLWASRRRQATEAHRGEKPTLGPVLDGSKRGPERWRGWGSGGSPESLTPELWFEKETGPARGQKALPGFHIHKCTQESMKTKLEFIKQQAGCRVRVGIWGRRCGEHRSKGSHRHREASEVLEFTPGEQGTPGEGEGRSKESSRRAMFGAEARESGNVKEAPPSSSYCMMCDSWCRRQALQPAGLGLGIEELVKSGAWSDAFVGLPTPSLPGAPVVIPKVDPPDSLSKHSMAGVSTVSPRRRQENTSS